MLYSDEGESQRAVSEATAFLMASMLADVINAGTAYRARQSGFTLPAAGKTGTTNDYVDAWFVGFTPKLVTGVWVGFDQPQTIIANGYAGELAVPIWAAFMKRRDARRQARMVRASGERRRRQRLPAVGKAAERRLRERAGRRPTRASSKNARWSTPSIFVQGTQPTDDVPAASVAARSWIAWPGSSARTPVMPVSVDAAAFRRQAAASTSGAPVPSPAIEHRSPRRLTGRTQGRGAARRSAASGARLFGGGDDDRRRKKREEEGRGARRKTKKRGRPLADGVMPFRDIVGHRASARAAGRRGRARQSLPPSLIFAGPDGVGKRHGRRRAGAVAQLPRPTHAGRATDACGTCPSCTRIARGVHADVLHDRAWRHGQRSRSIRCATRSNGPAYRPFEGRRRVVIVDEADAMVIGSAECAAEDPRRAARGLDVRAGDVASRSAAADGAVAMSAAAVRQAVARRHRCRADAIARLRGGGRARGGVSVGWQHWRRARGRARRVSSTRGMRRCSLLQTVVVVDRSATAARRCESAGWRRSTGVRS